jgi:hypothetical protein
MSTFTLSVLFIAFTALFYGWIDHVVDQRKKKAKIRTAHAEWMELATGFAEWRSSNKFSNHETPQYQWFVRMELALFMKYAKLARRNARPMRQYEGYLRHHVVMQIQPQRPPGFPLQRIERH